MLYLAFEELVKPAELEQTGTLPEEVGGLNDRTPFMARSDSPTS